MTPPSMRRLPMRRLPWLLMISALVLALDRATKDWISQHIPLGGAIPVLPPVLRLSHWLNEGAAFSLFADSSSPHRVRWALVVFSFVAAAVVLVVLVRVSQRFSLVSVALALILGGAIGNAHDRILYGSVVDFIEVHIFTYHWPDFNVADSSIVTGACLLLLDSLLPSRKSSGSSKSSSSPKSSGGIAEPSTELAPDSESTRSSEI